MDKMRHIKPWLNLYVHSCKKAHRPTAGLVSNWLSMLCSKSNTGDFNNFWGKPRSVRNSKAGRAHRAFSMIVLSHILTITAPNSPGLRQICFLLFAAVRVGRWDSQTGPRGWWFQIYHPSLKQLHQPQIQLFNQKPSGRIRRGSPCLLRALHVISPKQLSGWCRAAAFGSREQL